MKDLDYWKECISLGAEECDLVLTKEQLACLADSVSAGHEHYGMAFYSPPSSDRIHDIERDWKAKLDAKERELQRVRSNGEEAIKQALGVHREDSVSIGSNGEVLRHGGRTERIQ